MYSLISFKRSPRGFYRSTELRESGHLGTGQCDFGAHREDTSELRSLESRALAGHLESVNTGDHTRPHHIGNALHLPPGVSSPVCERVDVSGTHGVCSECTSPLFLSQAAGASGHEEQPLIRETVTGLLHS